MRLKVYEKDKNKRIFLEKVKFKPTYSWIQTSEAICVHISNVYTEV